MPTKALKSRRTMTPGAASQPPCGGSRTAEEIVEQYRAVMARGASTARAQTGADNAGGRIAEEDVQPSVEGEAGRGGTEDAARPDAGKGGGSDGAVPGRPVGPVEVEDPVLEPEEVRDDGAATVARCRWEGRW